jgi:hypothetical protein
MRERLATWRHRGSRGRGREYGIDLALCALWMKGAKVERGKGTRARPTVG